MLQVWQQPSNLPLSAAAKAVLSRVLLGYNSRIAYLLMKGFSEGFKINYQGPRITSTAPNLGSAYPDVVDEKLRKERE